MEFGNLGFTILNLFGFVILGIAWSYILKREWEKLKRISIKKFVYLAGSSSSIGGLFGLLVNGVPQTGISIGNMTLASFFAILSIVAYYYISVKHKIPNIF